MGDPAGSLIHITVKYGQGSLQVSLPAEAPVKDLMERLFLLTNVLPRGQKLIFKGKVLEATKSLTSANVTTGSKVMLVASQGLHQGGTPVSRTMKVPTSKLPTEKAITSRQLTKSRIESWKSTGIASLRESNLVEVPGEIWTVNSSLRVLDLDQNKLSKIPSEIRVLLHLKRLCLNNNVLADDGICWEDLSCLKNLTYLSLDHNLLTVLPAQLVCICSLKYLSASHNKVASIDENIGSLFNLEKLGLSHNSLNEIPPGLGKCSAMRELDLSANYLKEVPSTLGNLKKLKDLDLRNNGLKELPAEIFQGCEELTSLSIHGNEITIEKLRELEGWENFDERRKLKYTKQLDFQVMGSNSGFDEGGDVERAHHW